MALTDQICKLLPSGQAWIKAPSTNLYRTVALFAGALQRAIDFCAYAQRDTFPTTCVDSLSAWQSSCNLPDPLCPPLTTQQQFQQMVSRVENLGGQSPAYFVQVAAKIGYTITIQECAQARAGLSRAGQAQSWYVGGDFVWIVNVANAALYQFRAGLNRAGQPLDTASDTRWLQYELDRIAPSQTQIVWL